MESEKHYCTNCKDRIFRRGFKINDNLYCKHCVYSLFGIKFSDAEYIVLKKDKAVVEN